MSTKLGTYFVYVLTMNPITTFVLHISSHVDIPNESSSDWLKLFAYILNFLLGCLLEASMMDWCHFFS